MTVWGSACTTRPDKPRRLAINCPWRKTGRAASASSYKRRRLFHRWQIESVQAIHPRVAFTFEVNIEWGGKLERVLQPFMRGGIDMDHARRAFAGDTASQVHCVAPQIVNEFLFADDTGKDRASAY